MHSTKKRDFSHPKNRLEEDRYSATYHMMGFVQDYSQLIEYCGILHFLCNCFCVQSSYYLSYSLIEKLTGREISEK